MVKMTGGINKTNAAVKREVSDGEENTAAKMASSKKRGELVFKAIDLERDTWVECLDLITQELPDYGMSLRVFEE